MLTNFNCISITKIVFFSSPGKLQQVFRKCVCVLCVRVCVSGSLSLQPMSLISSINCKSSALQLQLRAKVCNKKQKFAAYA